MDDKVTLSSLKHGLRTNLKKGIVNNHDAALLAMAESQEPIVKSRNISASLRAWRKNQSLHFRYIFNSQISASYGYVGSNIGSERHVIPTWTGTVTRRTYWYRVRKGHYAITAEGHRRLQELAAQAG